jgi:hypothetical protein
MPNPTAGAAPANSTLDQDWPIWRSRVLKGLAVCYGLSTTASFIESFRGLIDWFTYNHRGGILSWLAPLMIDVVALAGEAILLLAIMERWDWRARWAAGSATLLMLAASVVGNVGRNGFPRGWYHHVPIIMANAAAPLALSGFTALGLVVVKRLFHPKKKKNDGGVPGVPEDALTALIHFRTAAEFGPLPSIREIRNTAGGNQDRAYRIRGYLEDFQRAFGAPGGGDPDRTRVSQ